MKKACLSRKLIDGFLEIITVKFYTDERSNVQFVPLVTDIVQRQAAKFYISTKRKSLSRLTQPLIKVARSAR